MCFLPKSNLRPSLGSQGSLWGPLKSKNISVRAPFLRPHRSGHPVILYKCYFSLENQLLQKEDVISNLHGALEESKRKTEFKSNLERSFESLQNQFQMKVDEIERLRKRLGIDDNKNRRPSKEKKLI